MLGVQKLGSIKEAFERRGTSSCICATTTGEEFSSKTKGKNVEIENLVEDKERKTIAKHTRSSSKR